MRLRLQGGPGHGRVYDFPTPLAGAYGFDIDGRREVYTLTEWTRPRDPNRAEPIYRHTRTEVTTNAKSR